MHKALLLILSAAEKWPSGICAVWPGSWPVSSPGSQTSGVTQVGRRPKLSLTTAHPGRPAPASLGVEVGGQSRWPRPPVASLCPRPNTAPSFLPTADSCHPASCFCFPRKQCSLHSWLLGVFGISSDPILLGSTLHFAPFTSCPALILPLPLAPCLQPAGERALP